MPRITYPRYIGYSVSQNGNLWTTQKRDIDYAQNYLLKPTDISGDLKYLEQVQKNNQDKQSNELYILLVEQVFEQKTKMTNPSKRPRVSIISETAYSKEKPDETINRCLMEEFGVKIPDMSKLKTIGSGNWIINNNKKITSFTLSPSDLEPYSEPEYTNNLSDTQKPKDDSRFKSILYLIGTEKEFNDFFKKNRYCFSSLPDENITGYLLVPLSRMIDLYRRLNNQITHKFIPLRIMWNNYKKNQDNEELRYQYKQAHLKYLKELTGNHQWKISQIEEDKSLNPVCPTIYNLINRY